MTPTPDVYTRESITTLLDELSVTYQTPAPAPTLPANGNGNGNGHANGKSSDTLGDFTIAVEPLELKKAEPKSNNGAFSLKPAQQSWSITLDMLTGRWQPPQPEPEIVAPQVEEPPAAQITVVETIQLGNTKPRSFAQMKWAETLNAIAGRDGTVQTFSVLPKLEELDPAVRWKNNATRSPGANIAEFIAEISFN
jgi:hypothetical protein